MNLKIAKKFFKKKQKKSKTKILPLVVWSHLENGQAFISNAEQVQNWPILNLLFLF